MDNAVANVHGFLGLLISSFRGQQVSDAEVSKIRSFLGLFILNNQMHPCPGCGLYQREMIRPRRARTRLFLFVAALACLVPMLAGASDDHLPPQWVSWIMGALCAVLCVAQFLVELANANKDLAANQAIGRQEVAVGKLRHVPATSPPAAYARQVAELAQPARSQVSRLALLLLLMSVVAEISPEVIRAVHGWPVNDQCYPPVVGPWDETKFYLPNELKSINGFWRGGPLITLVCPGSPLDGTHIDATSSKENWGNFIFDADSKGSTWNPWVSMTMPGDPSLAGKKININIDLGVIYPQSSVGQTVPSPQISSGPYFTEKSEDIKQTLQIKLASVGAGRQYNTLFWAGTIGGVPLALLGSFLLYRRESR